MELRSVRGVQGGSTVPPTDRKAMGGLAATQKGVVNLDRLIQAI